MYRCSHCPCARTWTACSHSGSRIRPCRDVVAWLTANGRKVWLNGASWAYNLVNKIFDLIYWTLRVNQKSSGTFFNHLVWPLYWDLGLTFETLAHLSCCHGLLLNYQTNDVNIVPARWAFLPVCQWPCICDRKTELGSRGWERSTL